jgi:hypothetical protein
MGMRLGRQQSCLSLRVPVQFPDVSRTRDADTAIATVQGANASVRRDIATVHRVIARVQRAIARVPRPPPRGQLALAAVRARSCAEGSAFSHGGSTLHACDRPPFGGEQPPDRGEIPLDAKILGLIGVPNRRDVRDDAFAACEFALVACEIALAACDIALDGGNGASDAGESTLAACDGPSDACDEAATPR